VVVREGVYPDYLPPPEGAPPPNQYWYYCDSPEGYYPYVESCHHEWQPVPATPSGAPTSQTGDGPRAHGLQP